MGDSIDKLLDRIPAAEGDFRRRITAGGLILIAIAASFLQSDLSDLGSVKWVDLIRSPTLLIAIFLLVYAAGHLTEMVAEVFAARIGGNMLWAISEPTDLVKTAVGWRKLVPTLAWPFQVVANLYMGFFLGLVGVSRYRWKNIRNALSPEAKNYFEHLPNVIQGGFANPFGHRIEVSWWFLRSRSQPTERRWLAKLEARNKDILCILTALLPLSQILLLRISQSPRKAPVDYLAYDRAFLFFMVQAALGALLLLFGGYFVVLRNSIILALEVVSHAPVEDRVTTPRPDP